MKALKCATYNDELRLVDVESSFNRGLPALNIVGLAGASIKESAERVKSAASLGLTEESKVRLACFLSCFF